jgi:SAM-dependent methyltransferase
MTPTPLGKVNPVLDDGVLRSVVLPQLNHWGTGPFYDTCQQWDIQPVVTSRLWEWVMVDLILKAVTTPKHRIALGIGVGNEPVVSTAEALFDRVIAIDTWRTEWKASPHDVISTAHRVVADGTRLPVRDRSIDVVWSVSSIEHFHQSPGLLARVGRGLKRAAGSVGVSTPWKRDAALRALVETERALAPEGVAVISTEIVITSRSAPEFFGFSEFLGLAARARLHLVSDRCTVSVDDYFLQHVLKRKEIRAWDDPTPHIYRDFDGTVFMPAVFVFGLPGQQIEHTSPREGQRVHYPTRIRPQAQGES